MLIKKRDLGAYTGGEIGESDMAPRQQPIKKMFKDYENYKNNNAKYTPQG